MNTDKDIIFKDILVIAHKKENADFSYSSNERAGAGYIIIYLVTEFLGVETMKNA